MTDFLRELGYSPLRYWLLAAATFILWFGSTVFPRKTSGSLFSRLNHPAVFGALLLAAMFAWRWPAIFFYKPVNPDESQFLASAITTLARGDIWWTDPMTSGPLVVLPLTLPALFGFPIDFVSGRIVGLLLGWAIVFLGYLSIRHVHGDRLGRLLSLPLGCFVVFLLFWDFVPYCSEWSPLFLGALALWLCLTAFQNDGRLTSRWRLIIGGLVLGTMPFSKLQVLPFTAVIGLSTISWILRQPGVALKERLSTLILLLASSGVGFGVMLLNLYHSGNWADEVQSYVVHNMYYTKARGLPWSESGYVLHYLTDLSWGFSSFHFGLLILLAIGQVGLHRGGWRPILLGWALLAAGYCAVLVPGRLYPHYLLFLSLPLALLVGLQFGYVLKGQSRRYCTVIVALFLALGGGGQLIDRIRDNHDLHRLIAVPNARQAVAHIINGLKQPGDTLAVWGWRPELYIETQLPQATREALTEAQLSDQPQREYFRDRFLADMQSNRPAFFVDSVGPDDYLLKDRAVKGHEVIPALVAYLEKEYQPVGDTSSFRVYLRRDRVPAAELKQ